MFYSRPRKLFSHSHSSACRAATHVTYGLGDAIWGENGLFALELGERLFEDKKKVGTTREELGAGNIALCNEVRVLFHLWEREKELEGEQGPNKRSSRGRTFRHQMPPCSVAFSESADHPCT